jgi:polyribonucleotide nucleotidyltransferase
MITTTDVEKGAQAEKLIREIVRVVEVGEIFEEAEVVKIMPFGAFCSLTPSTDGMLHVSEIEWGHVDKVTDRVNLGDKLKVKVIKIERGKVDVSMKALTPKPEGYVERPRRSSSRFGDRRGGRGGDRCSSSRQDDRRSDRRDDRRGDRRDDRKDEPKVNRDGYSREKKDPRLSGDKK